MDNLQGPDGNLHISYSQNIQLISCSTTDGKCGWLKIASLLKFVNSFDTILTAALVSKRNLIGCPFISPTATNPALPLTDNTICGLNSLAVPQPPGPARSRLTLVCWKDSCIEHALSLHNSNISARSALSFVSVFE